MKSNLRLERKEELRPLCPHCRKQLDSVSSRELVGGFWGKRYIYFCPGCRATLGVSHRKGFFMG
jgi:uncharacterized protein YbaR (Trm112 family)